MCFTTFPLADAEFIRREMQLPQRHQGNSGLFRPKTNGAVRENSPKFHRVEIFTPVCGTMEFVENLKNHWEIQTV